MAEPVVSGDPRQALARLRAGVTRLADELFRLETEPEYALVREGAPLEGRSAQVATDAATRMQGLWERYPLLKDAVDRFEVAVATQDDDAQRAVLAAGAITLPDGSDTSVRDLLATLERDLAATLKSVDELAGAWRTIVPCLDTATATLTRLAGVAAELGLPEDRELGNARRLVTHVADHAARDPLGVDPAPAVRAVEDARSRLDDLATKRRALPPDLDAARSLLGELARLIPQGRTALEDANRKIAHPDGLLEPIAPGVLHEGPRALGPWLTRLEALAAKGSWLAAVEGLSRWQAVAEGWLANARRVVGANQAPVRRRNELRGLLDAYQAKAAARGVVEQETIVRLHRAASEVLTSRPCDLDRAGELVQRFGQAINEAPVAPGQEATHD